MILKSTNLELQKEPKSLNIVPANNSHTKLTVEGAIESICQSPGSIMTILGVLEEGDVQWRLSQELLLFSQELTTSLQYESTPPS